MWWAVIHATTTTPPPPQEHFWKCTQTGSHAHRGVGAAHNHLFTLQMDCFFPKQSLESKPLTADELSRGCSSPAGLT